MKVRADFVLCESSAYMRAGQGVSGVFLLVNDESCVLMVDDLLKRLRLLLYMCS